MSYPKTAVKRAFYLIFASLVRKCSAKEVIDNWEEADIDKYPAQCFEITEYFDANKSTLDEKIVANVKSGSINGVPLVDLAIIYAHLISVELGTPANDAIHQIADFAGEFGATSSSIDFCYAVLSNICK